MAANGSVDGDFVGTALILCRVLIVQIPLSTWCVTLSARVETSFRL